MGGLSLSNFLNPAKQGKFLDSINNPAKAIVEDTQSKDPLQAFLDPADVFGGMLASAPAVPAVPATPTAPTSYKPGFTPFRTNYGSFDTPIMQDVLSKLHPSVPYQAPDPAASAASGAPAATSQPAVASPGADFVNANPPGTPASLTPARPGAPQVRLDAQSEIVRPTAFTSAQRQYAQTPNTVVSQSSMTVPGTAVVVNPANAAPAPGAAPAAGIKPGLLGGGAAATQPMPAAAAR